MMIMILFRLKVVVLYVRLASGRSLVTGVMLSAARSERGRVSDERAAVVLLLILSAEH